MNESQIDEKFDKLTLYSAIAIFISFFYFLKVRHLIEKQKIDFIEWDLATITAADYTVERKITKEEYDAFVQNKYTGTEPVGYAFKCYFKEKVE